MKKRRKLIPPLEGKGSPAPTSEALGDSENKPVEKQDGEGNPSAEISEDETTKPTDPQALDQDGESVQAPEDHKENNQGTVDKTGQAATKSPTTETLGTNTPSGVKDEPEEDHGDGGNKPVEKQDGEGKPSAKISEDETTKPTDPQALDQDGKSVQAPEDHKEKDQGTVDKTGPAAPASPGANLQTPVENESTSQENIINTILKKITSISYTTERSSKKHREMISNVLSNINLTNIDLTEFLADKRCSRDVKVALLQLNNLSINQKIQILDSAINTNGENTTSEIIAYCNEHKNLQEIKTFAKNYYDHRDLIKSCRKPDLFIGLFMTNDLVWTSPNIYLPKIQIPQDLPLEVVKVFFAPTTFTKKEKDTIKASFEDKEILYSYFPEEVTKLKIISAWICDDKENLQKLFNENNTSEIKDLNKNNTSEIKYLFEQLKEIYDEKLKDILKEHETDRTLTKVSDD